MRFVTSSCLAGAFAFLGSGAWAQSVVSAHSGLVHYVEGRVLLADKEIDPKFGEFPEIKPNEVLKTEEGRAEVLLSPGVFLRIGENSSIRMISNHLTDTRLELLAGRALVESAADAMKDDAVTFQLSGDSVRIVRSGLYELFAAPPSVRVYQGEASIAGTGAPVTLRKGREATLTASLDEHKFDTANTDDLYNWTSRRSADLAAANIVSAKTIASNSGYGSGLGGFSSDNALGLPDASMGVYNNWGPGFDYAYSGFGYGGFGSSGMMMGLAGYGGWMWNPWFGMFTFVPSSGMLMDPFGYAFFSPSTVGYALPYYYGTTGGVGRGITTPRTGRTMTSPYTLAAVHMAAHSAAMSARSSFAARSGSGAYGTSARGSLSSLSATSASATSAAPASVGRAAGRR